MARLFVLSGSRIGSTFDFFETSTVGRGEDADIVIAEASISRSHARLIPRPDPGQWKIVDLKSSNGVFVGGKRVTSGIITGGETFRLGEIELRLRDDAGEEGTPEWSEPQDSVEQDSDGGGGDGFELEFGDDLDDAIASQAGQAEPSKRTIPPAPGQAKTPADAGTRAGARATAQRAQRRQEALKGSSVGARASVAGTPNPSGSSRPVLQYSAAHHRSHGDDLAQWSNGKRALVVLLGVALMGGIAYGAFTLTRTARDHSAALSDEPAE